MNPLGGDENLTGFGGAGVGGAKGDLEAEPEVGRQVALQSRTTRAWCNGCTRPFQGLGDGFDSRRPLSGAMNLAVA